MNKKQNPWWPEELACWAPPKREVKKISIGKELNAMGRWAFDPKTKLSQLTFKGWQSAKNKLRQAGKKGGKSYGSVNF